MDKELIDLFDSYMNTVSDLIDYISNHRNVLGEQADAMVAIIAKIWAKEGK